MAREVMFVDGGAGASVTLGNTITIPITPAFPDSINRALVITVGNYDTSALDNTVASVTVGGVAATLVKLQQGVADASIYVFRNPPKTTFNVVVTFVQAATNGRCYVREIEQLDPLDGVGVTDGNFGTASNDTRTLTDAAMPDALAFHVTAALGGITNITVTDPTFGTDDTVQVGASPNRTRIATSGAPNQASPLSLRHNISVSKPFGHAAAEFRGETLFPQASLVGMGF